MTTSVKKRLTDTLIFAVSASLAALPWHGAARAETAPELKNAAKIAQQTGKQAASGIKNNMLQMGGDYKSLTPLHQKDSASMTEDQVASLMGIYNYEDEYANKGESYKSDLYQRSLTADGSDPDAAAYSVINHVASIPTGNLGYDDPMFKKSGEIFDNIDAISKEFADCKSVDKFFKTEKTVHVPELEQCTQVIDKSGSCELKHDYLLGAIQEYDSTWGNTNMKADGVNQQIMWIGQVGDNYWSGNCTLFEHYARTQFTNPEAVTKAVIEYAKWDDYMQIWVGLGDDLKKVWQGPNATDFPYRDPSTGKVVGSGACELKTSWSRNLSVDVTDIIRKAKPKDILTFKIRASVTGSGEAYARMRFWIKPDKMVTNDNWLTPGCMEMAKAVSDGFASGSLKCTSMPSSLDANRCFVYQGMNICEKDFKDPGLPGISPVCKRVAVTANYDFYKGQMDCFVDASGNEQCFENNGGNLKACQLLEDTGCVYLSSECADGASGASGTCYVYTNTYDCGYEQIVSSPSVETETKCAGMLACTGSDCIDPDTKQSTDFTKVAALLNVAQQASKDMECTGVDEDGNPLGDRPVECTLFSGKDYNCKVAVGGVQNCCEKPNNISVADYIRTLFVFYQADSAVMALENQSGTLIGSYQELHNAVGEVINQGFSQVTKPFVSYIENISGAVSEYTTPVSEMVNQVVSALKEEITSMLNGVANSMGITGGGSGAVAGGGTGAAGSTGSGSAAGSLGSTVMGAAAVIGYVYAAYCVAMLVIQTVWKCTEEEYELNANRALKQCHYVGSYCKKKTLGACIEKRQTYCCYKSPLARILQEQIRPLNGRDFGTAKHPSCGELSIEEFSNVDWDKINLDEWVALMQEAGMFGADTDKIALEGLTGKGSALDTDGTRQNAAERAQTRLEGVDLEGVMRGFQDSISVDNGSGNAR